MVFETHGFCNCRLQKRGVFLVPESYRWEFIKQESAGVKQLAAETGYPEVFAGLLAARGVHNKEEAQRFLYPSEKNMYDPFLMKGMEAAVCRISQAMDAHEKITIYGDYDVDGITATSILYLYLSKAGADVNYYLPDRMTEGYAGRDGDKADGDSGYRDFCCQRVSVGKIIGDGCGYYGSS